ncbi:hypothetical protein ARMGADRAFT_80873 [Armillaria gallica]|uniref:Uncharacterized protein n=1 Tax=Armillaria gallica TaxID=47427 RepID=A0A2H3CYC8_ARMGA|nr:hypothetical protein ARMGADRAFT_80873 [Armillaria gallica]
MSCCRRASSIFLPPENNTGWSKLLQRQSPHWIVCTFGSILAMSNSSFSTVAFASSDCHTVVVDPSRICDCHRLTSTHGWTYATINTITMLCCLGQTQHQLHTIVGLIPVFPHLPFDWLQTSCRSHDTV